MAAKRFVEVRRQKGDVFSEQKDNKNTQANDVTIFISPVRGWVTPLEQSFAVRKNLRVLVS